jgi:hypothetical protein
MSGTAFNEADDFVLHLDDFYARFGRLGER